MLVKNNRSLRMTSENSVTCAGHQLPRSWSAGASESDFCNETVHLSFLKPFFYR